MLRKVFFVFFVFFEKGFEATCRLNLQNCYDESVMCALNKGLGSGSSIAGEQEDKPECEESSFLAGSVPQNDTELEVNRG